MERRNVAITTQEKKKKAVTLLALNSVSVSGL